MSELTAYLYQKMIGILIRSLYFRIRIQQVSAKNATTWSAAKGCPLREYRVTHSYVTIIGNLTSANQLIEEVIQGEGCSHAFCVIPFIY